MADGTANLRNLWQIAGLSPTFTGALLLLLAVGDLLHFPLAFGCLAAVVTTAEPPRDEEEGSEGSGAVPRTLTRGHPGDGRLPRKPPHGSRSRPSTATADNPFLHPPLIPFSPAHPKQNGLGGPLLC
jgi:hypothetical protein